MTLRIDVADDPYRDEDEEDLLRPRRRRSFLSAERDLDLAALRAAGGERAGLPLGGDRLRAA